MSEQTLQEKLDSAGDIVEFLRNQQVGPNVYPGVPAEYSNWRNEQAAWAKSAVLFNQSYHMVELYVRGPDAFDLLQYTAINSFKGFAVNKAKQYVPVSRAAESSAICQTPSMPRGPPPARGTPRR